MVINGMVINVIFENKDNGYTVAHIESNGEKITIVGSMPSLYEGMYVQVTGKSDKVPITGVILNVYHVINWQQCCRQITNNGD